LDDFPTLRDAGEPWAKVANCQSQQAKPWAPPNTNSATNNSSTAEAIMSKTYAPVKYVVPGVFVEGLTLFAGKPKVGKSWFLLHSQIMPRKRWRSPGRCLID
jgi:hypothetical protein